MLRPSWRSKNRRRRPLFFFFLFLFLSCLFLVLSSFPFLIPYSQRCLWIFDPFLFETRYIFAGALLDFLSFLLAFLLPLVSIAQSAIFTSSRWKMIKRMLRLLGCLVALVRRAGRADLTSDQLDSKMRTARSLFKKREFSLFNFFLTPFFQVKKDSWLKKRTCCVFFSGAESNSWFIFGVLLSLSRLLWFRGSGRRSHTHNHSPRLTFARCRWGGEKCGRIRVLASFGGSVGEGGSYRRGGPAMMMGFSSVVSGFGS